MKWITGILAAVIIMTSAVPAFASGGSVAGQYYSTDIRALLNGAEIDSINIGGQTLISAEDMESYSFSVFWNGEARQLEVYRAAQENSGPPPVVSKLDDPPGKVLGNYYTTDIVTLLDGKPITAYNIGGRTYIHAEQMRDWGYVVDWNAADRTLSVTSPDLAGYVYNIALSQGNRPESDTFSDDGAGAFAISYENGELTGRGDAALFSSTLSCDGLKYTVSMGFYQNEGLFYSAKLQELLKSMCYLQSGTELARPEEKYGFINAQASLVINGHKAEGVKVTQWGGNGHVDFGFEITNIPLYREGEIESVYFSVGDTSGMETYRIDLFP